MQDYIKGVTYVKQELTNSNKGTAVEYMKRLQIDPMHPSYRDHREVFSHEGYKYPYMPLYLGQYNIDVDKVNVNVLRLIIRTNNRGCTLALPVELEPLRDFICAQINYHNQYYPTNADSYIYITVRTRDKDCNKNSKTWHVDGFQGSRIDRHLPEQDIIWSNINPTEFLLQPFYLDGMNPSKHDVNQYFDDNANENMAMSGLENGVYMCTPYNVHRACNDTFDKKRVFIRLTFSPVLIQDSTNTYNPAFPKGVFDGYDNRDDVRNHLWKYEIDETMNNGFKSIK
jgi:hypothetical protein